MQPNHNPKNHSHGIDPDLELKFLKAKLDQKDINKLKRKQSKEINKIRPTPLLREPTNVGQTTDNLIGGKERRQSFSRER